MLTCSSRTPPPRAAAETVVPTSRRGMPMPQALASPAASESQAAAPRAAVPEEAVTPTPAAQPEMTDKGFVGGVGRHSAAAADAAPTASRSAQPTAQPAAQRGPFPGGSASQRPVQLPPEQRDRSSPVAAAHRHAEPQVGQPLHIGAPGPAASCRHTPQADAHLVCATTQVRL